jgi:hypothetical protein
MVAAQPGDLILVRSHGLVFAAGRRLTRSSYDHVAVVVAGGQTVNIDKPMTRRLAIERLLRADHEPLVVRPAWRDPAARAAFVDWMESLVDSTYDVRRTLRLLASLVLRRAGVRLPLSPPRAEGARWICTDAVLVGFERHLADFATAELALDWRSLRCGTTNDFLEISRRRPDLLAPVT